MGKVSYWVRLTENGSSGWHEAGNPQRKLRHWAGDQAGLRNVRLTSAAL